jgi:membrane protein
MRAGIELVVRTVRDAAGDRVPGLAAEIAFFMVLSLPPLLLTVLGSVGYVGQWFGARAAEGLRSRLMEGAQAIFTPDTIEGVIRPMLDTLLEQGRADVASFGILISLWSASLAFNVMLEALHIAYDLDEHKPARWKRRLHALGATLAAVLVGIAMMPVFVAGPKAGYALRERLGLAQAFAEAWQVLYWPIMTLLATLVLSVLYHYGAPRKTPWRREVPGAVLAMAVWLIGSLALRHYAAVTVETEHAVYRQFSAPLVVLLWLYVSGFAILLGAELNSEIEKMWPSPGSGPSTSLT